MFLSKKKEEKKQANIFIEIDLDRKRGKRYPEYNFMDLVNDQKKRMNTYNDDDDSKFVDPDAAEIVKRLEAKYGNKKSKKARFHVDDFVDKGQGYDLSDPFVDDTDIYDEYVPSTVSTCKGGFYVNRGKLDFKNVHNEDDSSDEEKRRAPVIPGSNQHRPPNNNPNRPSNNERSNNQRQERAPPIPVIQQRAPAISIERNLHQRAPAIPNERNTHQRAPTIPVIHQRAPSIPNGKNVRAIPIERSTHQRAPSIPNGKNHREGRQRAPVIPNLVRVNAKSSVTKEKSPAHRGK